MLEEEKTPQPKQPEKKPKKLWTIMGILLIVVTLALTGFTVVRAWPLVRYWQELRAKEKQAEELAEAEKFLGLKEPEEEPEKKPEADDKKPELPPEKKEEIVVLEVTASSYLTDPEVKFDYSAKMAVDGDIATSWVEADEGDGIGEWIKFDFLKAAKVSKLKIWPGYARDKDVYFKNNRLKNIRVEFSHDPSEFFVLTDEYKMHEVSFSPVTTDYVRIVIVDVWPGSKFKDTCIAEVELN